jgi:hypothetical protein
MLQFTEYPSGNVCVQVVLMHLCIDAARAAFAAGPDNSMAPVMLTDFPVRSTFRPGAGEKVATGNTSR